MDTCTGTQPETNMLPLLLRSWWHNEFSHTIVKGKEYKVYVTFRPITTSYHTGISMKEYFVFLCQSLIYVKAQIPYKCPYVPISVFKQCFHWLGIFHSTEMWSLFTVRMFRPTNRSSVKTLYKMHYFPLTVC